MLTQPRQLVLGKPQQSVLVEPFRELDSIFSRLFHLLRLLLRLHLLLLSLCQAGSTEAFRMALL